MNEAYEYAMKCTEFADSREEDKALLREISSKRGAGQGQGPGGLSGGGLNLLETGGQSVITNRLRSGIIVSSPRRQDLEPVNLNFQTP